MRHTMIAQCKILIIRYYYISIILCDTSTGHGLKSGTDIDLYSISVVRGYKWSLLILDKKLLSPYHGNHRI